MQQVAGKLQVSLRKVVGVGFLFTNFFFFSIWCEEQCGEILIEENLK